MSSQEIPGTAILTSPVKVANTKGSSATCSTAMPAIMLEKLARVDVPDASSFSTTRSALIGRAPSLRALTRSLEATPAGDGPVWPTCPNCHTCARQAHRPKRRTNRSSTRAYHKPINVPSPNSLEVLVIGAGPAGVIAALRAARLGARTALVTRDEFGGMAANDGPVPVRTLAQAARLMREARQFSLYGIEASSVSLGLSAGSLIGSMT